ncbi:MAG TPA: hypothetical protein H9734_09585 [Candidatus Fusicatenibacter merdavium]|uniref:Uncharacterized protein n=1 Tax=Candidatus Fusicatenibacter merdavium TaxID=2838600 RepID=A0A9D1XE11_9FIRM|nr:hypothetical protein [Candidatus Fusicatenibacter merdavium]
MKIYDFVERKTPKSSYFPKKMSGFEVFSGLREHEMRSNPQHHWVKIPFAPYII